MQSDAVHSTACPQPIQMLSSTKSSLAIQLEDAQRENSDLNGQVRALHKAQRKSHRKQLLLQAALEEAEVKSRSSEHYLKSVVRMVWSEIFFMLSCSHTLKHPIPNYNYHFLGLKPS